MPQTQRSKMKKRPNVLFLMSDEHRADVAGFAGDSVVRTPVLDELARTGVVFTNAYTPSPICVPARQCIAAGQLPKTCDCEAWTDLKPGYRTFAREFSRYAYTTCCSGKLHHLGQDQMMGWRSRIAADCNVADNHVDDPISSEFERYKSAPETGKWSNQREVEESRPTPTEGPYQTQDRFAVEAAVNYLERYFQDRYYQRPQSHRPLLFKLSLVQPHYPYFTDPERFEYYHHRVPIYTDKPCDHPVLSLSQLNKPVDLNDTDIRRATACYYSMIDQVDCHYGTVLEKLKSLGEDLDDWIIIYTSDHGEMLGQHGIWEKTRFYEASVKVPLIIRWPKGFQGGRSVDANVNLCDLFATLCDLCGLDIPEGLDSRSLVPLLKGEPCAWMNETASQVYRGGNHVMIKHDDLKYQYYGATIPEVLFDLKADPSENCNVAEAPEYAEAMQNFRKRLSELGYGPNADPDYLNAGYAS